MSFYDSALDRLHEAHDCCEKSGTLMFWVTRDELTNLIPEERHKMESDFKIMQDEGWIVPYTPCVGTPYSFKLTAEGVRVAEERLYASMDDFIRLVRNHEEDSATQQEILSVLKTILQKMNDKEALEPGLLKELNTHLQGSSWLSAPVINLIMNYLLK